MTPIVVGLLALGGLSIVAFFSSLRDPRANAILEGWATRVGATRIEPGAFRARIGEVPVDIERHATMFGARARYALGHGPRYDATCFETERCRFPMTRDRIETALRDGYVIGGDVGIAQGRLRGALRACTLSRPIAPPAFRADGESIAVFVSVDDGEAGLAFASQLAARLAMDDVAHVRPLIGALGGVVVLSDIGLLAIDVAGRIPIRVTPRVGPAGSVLTRLRAELGGARTSVWRHPYDGPADEVLPILTVRADVRAALAALPIDVRVVLEIDAMEIVFPRFPSVAEARTTVQLIELLLAPAPAGPFR